MNWCKLENVIGEPLPRCIKHILCSCAFDSLITIEHLNEEYVKLIEQHVSDNRNILYELECKHSCHYQSQSLFKFLPGHRILLIDLKKHVKKLREHTSQRFNGSDTIDTHFSAILTELLKTAELNADTDKNHAQYSDTIRYFFTYIYLQCGKSCYETLNRNLPIPSTKTIRKISIKLSLIPYVLNFEKIFSEVY